MVGKDLTCAPWSRSPGWPIATGCHAAHALLLARNDCGRSRARPVHGAHRAYEEPHGLRAMRTESSNQRRDCVNFRGPPGASPSRSSLTEARQMASPSKSVVSASSIAFWPTFSGTKSPSMTSIVMPCTSAQHAAAWL